MARNLGPRRIGKYPIEFKAKAVALSRLPAVAVKYMVGAIEISRLRGEA